MRPVQPDDLDREGWLLLHEVRLRGVFEVDDGIVVTTLVEAGFVVAVPAGHPAHAGRPRRARRVGARRARRRARSDRRACVPAASSRSTPSCSGSAATGRCGPAACPTTTRIPSTTGRSSTACRRSTTASVRSSRASHAVVDRFGAYRERLRAARRLVDDGDHEWLTSPRIDSYHTVWMQLHEDLLLALGKERASEH